MMEIPSATELAGARCAGWTLCASASKARAIGSKLATWTTMRRGSRSARARFNQEFETPPRPQQQAAVADRTNQPVRYMAVQLFPDFEGDGHLPQEETGMQGVRGITGFLSWSAAAAAPAKCRGPSTSINSAP